jgi:outer membrane protein insertion porin family
VTIKNLFRGCGLLWFLACLPIALGQVSPPKISKIEIQHVGPPAASDDLIRANIRVKVGDPYQRLAADDDVRNLYATGQFYVIRINVRPGENDSVILTYVVQGKPRLMDIKFQGNEEYSNTKLQKKLTSKIGEPLDEQKLFTDSQEIQKLYQKGGYPNTEVKYVLSLDESAGRGTVTFQIKESPKIKIARVDFPGATAFSESKLRGVITTRKYKWYSSWITKKGVFKDEAFDEDKEKLADYYRQHGYIDFELKGDPTFEYPTPDKLIIRFNIYEGRQYKVGSIKFTGNQLFANDQISKGLADAQHKGVLQKKVKIGSTGFKMDVGDTFTPKGFLDDVRQIEDFYETRGYLDASRTMEVTRIPNTETGTIDLEFKINEGQKSYIEKIEIRGNTRTKDRVIRRELLVSPGEVFDGVLVRASKDRIMGMDYFEKVDTRDEPTLVPNRKNLVISVDEKNTGKFSMGAGFSSVESLVGFAEMSQANFDLFHPPNFTGGGQKLLLRLRLGTELQDYQLSFVEPWFLGRKLQLGVDLYHHDYNFQSLENLYDERRTGMYLSLARALGTEHLIGTVGYRLENVDIKFHGNVTSSNGIPVVGPKIPQTLLNEEGSALVSKFDASIALDTRPGGLGLPDRGQRTEVSFEVAGPFGGEKDYYKIELKTHWYFKGFFTGHVVEVVGGMGVADSYGRSDEVPFYDRYYLGGINTLRGFEYRSVSPREAGSGSKEPIGGNSYWFSSVEYSFPIIDRLRLATFYDIGNVKLDSFTYNTESFSDNWGVGIRLNLPIGPLRLDYGIPIHHDKFNSDHGQFQISAGFERPF